MQMNAMMKINKEVMKERGEGLGAFGTTSAATASGLVDLPVPLRCQQPMALLHHHRLCRSDEDLEQFGIGKPNKRKLPRISHSF